MKLTKYSISAVLKTEIFPLSLFQKSLFALENFFSLFQIFNFSGMDGNG